MVLSFFIALDGRWLANSPKFERRVGQQHLVPLGDRTGGLEYGCKLLVKFRGTDGRIVIDEEAELVSFKNAPFLRSAHLAGHLEATRRLERSLLLFVEGTPREARCIVVSLTTDLFSELEQDDPALRLTAYGLPPSSATLFDAGTLVDAFHSRLSRADPELFGVHASTFLDAPHILVPLFEHVLGLRSSEQIEFPVRLKKLADQLRTLLLSNSSGSVRIERIRRDHQALWAEALGEKVSFLDGGAARIAGLPGREPLALRVGIYSVRPGVEEPTEREQWSLKAYVIGDMLEDPPGLRRADGEAPDRRRLQEAARYVLEPLTGLTYLQDNPDTRVLFLHGPLVNQFAEYDEGPPHFIPCLAPSFLERFGLTRAEVERVIDEIPSAFGRSLWNHFMAVYGYVQKQMFSHDRPVLGVVERTRGRWLTLGILERLVADGLVKESYTAKVREILERYDISDDFLF